MGGKYGISARIRHAGNGIGKETGTIRRPIVMANSYGLPYDSTDMNWSSADGNLYNRNGSANQKYLQGKIIALEGGDCVVLASGVAALSGVFFSLLKSGRSKTKVNDIL